MATGLLETVLLCNWVRSTRRLALRLYIEAIRLGNISLLKSMSKKMMLLAKAHAFKATKSADIFLFSYGCDVLFLQSAQNISSTVSNWPAQSYSGFCDWKYKFYNQILIKRQICNDCSIQWYSLSIRAFSPKYNNTTKWS